MSGLFARRLDDVGRRALDLYQDAPLPARAHVALRWLSCPFKATAALVPQQGRVLEVGCGHGLFSAYIALQSAERDVTGIDIDRDKVGVADTAAAQARAHGASMHVTVANLGSVPTGPWDAIVFVDVLYLLEPEAQRTLLKACIATLAPTGVLVIKEMGTEPRWKARWNLLQETLSVRVFQITEGDRLTFVPPAMTAEWLSGLGFHVQLHHLDRGRVHPHTALVASRLQDAG